MPESRWTKFSATRSALKIARAGPEMFSRVSPALTRWPSSDQSFDFDCGGKFAKGGFGKGQSGDDQRFARAHDRAGRRGFAARWPASSRRRCRCPRPARLGRPGGFLRRTIPRRQNGGEREKGKVKRGRFGFRDRQRRNQLPGLREKNSSANWSTFSAASVFGWVARASNAPSGRANQEDLALLERPDRAGVEPARGRPAMSSFPASCCRI